uniref:RNA-dependent RNA polymerase n=1 Tax=Downy mildew lesion associated ormycovirus 2 TaxID=3162770 RepID=A0AAT9QG05_9VIRU|nr:putative RNA-dependent RNA polymerase [Plasmopara viticola lesion-associated ormycovirus 2]
MTNISNTGYPLDLMYSSRGTASNGSGRNLKIDSRKYNKLNDYPFVKTPVSTFFDGRSKVLKFSDWEKERLLAVQLSVEEGISLKILKKFEDSDFKKQLKLFINSLLLWDSIPIEKAITIEEIFCRNLMEGPEFAKILKNLRYYSLLEKISILPTSHDEDFREWFGYDSFYHEANLIHWEEVTDDIPWSFIETRTDDAFYALLEEEFNLVLDNIRIREPTHIDVLLSVKNSGGWVPSMKKNSVYSEVHISTFGLGLPEKRGFMLGKRCMIQAMPAGLRDTSIPDPDSLFKIKHTHLILKQITERLDGSAMTTSRLSQELRKSSMRNPHLLIDIKKCGLTFPRRFLLMMGKVLTQKGYFNYLSEWKQSYLVDGKTTYATKNGFNLGWVNDAPTIIQCLILRIVKKQFPSITAVIFNDDSDWVLRGVKPQEIFLARSLIRLCYNSSGLILSDKKEILSHASVFCEIYNGFEENLFGDPRKRQIATRLLAKSMSASSLILKMNYYNNALEWYTEDIDLIFESAAECLRRTTGIPHWVFSIPKSLGGLSLYRENHLDRSYLTFENLTDKQKTYTHLFCRLRKDFSRKKLFIELREKPDLKKIEFETYESENRAILGECSDIQQEYEHIYSDNICVSDALIRVYESLSQPSVFDSLYDRKCIRLQRLVESLNSRIAGASLRLEPDPGG